MTNYVQSIAVDAVIDALAAFVDPFVTPAQVIRAQVNRTPQPKPAAVVLTELLQVDLETPTVNHDGAHNLLSISSPKQIDIQIDFYGPLAGEQCAVIKGAFRTLWAVSQFPSNIKPLYCNDGVQSPLITGEQQYASRWTLTASLQYNPAVTVPQQFADAASVAGTVPVDIFY